MDNIMDMVWIELRKATRSVMPLSTGIGFLMIPLACSVLMLIYKDPEFARSAGIISAKANLIGGTADWPTYMYMLSQATAIGGIILFSLVETWIFGREFVDGTMKDLMAVPIQRSNIVLAKFITTLIWSCGLIVEMFIISIALGVIIGLPQGTTDVVLKGSLTLAETSFMVMIAVMPVAYFASIGRGYFLAIGFAIIALATGNLLMIMGWGYLYPWAVPALFADVTKRSSDLIPASYLILAATGMVGVISTVNWWHIADQHR